MLLSSNVTCFQSRSLASRSVSTSTIFVVTAPVELTDDVGADVRRSGQDAQEIAADGGREISEPSTSIHPRFHPTSRRCQRRISSSSSKTRRPFITAALSVEERGSGRTQ